MYTLTCDCRSACRGVGQQVQRCPWRHCHLSGLWLVVLLQLAWLGCRGKAASSTCTWFASTRLASKTLFIIFPAFFFFFTILAHSNVTMKFSNYWKMNVLWHGHWPCIHIASLIVYKFKNNDSSSLPFLKTAGARCSSVFFNLGRDRRVISVSSRGYSGLQSEFWVRQSYSSYIVRHLPHPGPKEKKRQLTRNLLCRQAALKCRDLTASAFQVLGLET